jgi:hypothetical protein
LTLLQAARDGEQIALAERLAAAFSGALTALYQAGLLIDRERLEWDARLRAVMVPGSATHEDAQPVFLRARPVGSAAVPNRLSGPTTPFRGARLLDVVLVDRQLSPDVHLRTIDLYEEGLLLTWQYSDPDRISDLLEPLEVVSGAGLRHHWLGRYGGRLGELAIYFDGFQPGAEAGSLEVAHGSSGLRVDL